MPVLKNNRRELFAQLLFQGFTAVDAYEKAGYKRHDGNASTLANHPEVLERLEDLRAIPVGTRAIAARAKVTADSLIDESEQVRVGAMESKQYGHANGAIKNKSVLAGVWVEKSEVGGPGDFDHLTDDQLERLLVERLGALGLSVEVLPESGT